jgi:hypothetical protein
MKKIYMFMALLLFSGVILAQVQRSNEGGLSSVNVLKGIHTQQSTSAKAVVDSLHWDTGDPAHSIGTGTAASSFGVYSFFDHATLAPHNTAGTPFSQ